MDTLTVASAADLALQSEIAELLRRAGHTHHQAYITADGVDPDWAIWYAGYLQAHLGTVLSRSELVYRWCYALAEFYSPTLIEG